MDKAIAAIENGAGGNFLQAATGATLRKLTVSVEMMEIHSLLPLGVTR
jgi:hypothetical protein